MSNDPVPEHLADWIVALFAALEEAEPHSADGIRRLAGKRYAIIGLDDDLARVAFRGDRLEARRRVRWGSPSGRTDSTTVTDLLASYAEVSDAIADGRIDIVGQAEDVIAIASIIEVLVDAATRIPAMQTLSESFLASRGGSTEDGAIRFRERRRKKADERARERELLEREGLVMSRGGRSRSIEGETRL